jgi:signal transduction histidine kinase
VCHRIATDHHGTIEVSSREGRGAAFLVRLPLDASEVRGANDSAPEARPETA